MSEQGVRKVSKLIHERVTKEYDIYDDFRQYLETIARKGEYAFLFGDDRDFSTVTIDNVKYYSLYQYDMGMLLTEEAFNDFKNTAKRIFTLHESDLVRTQRNSNTRFTGHLSDEESVMNYMRDSRCSWLPRIYEEIDDEVDSLQNKINTLLKHKQMLLDDNYLRGKITSGYTISSDNIKQKS